MKWKYRLKPEQHKRLQWPLWRSALPKRALKGLWLQSYASLLKWNIVACTTVMWLPKEPATAGFEFYHFWPLCLIELTEACPKDTPLIKFSSLTTIIKNGCMLFFLVCFVLVSNKVINSISKNVNPKSLIVDLTCFVSTERKCSLTLSFTFVVMSHYQGELNMNQWNPAQTSRRLREAWKNLLGSFIKGWAE